MYRPLKSAVLVIVLDRRYFETVSELYTTSSNLVLVISQVGAILTQLTE
jgi:hypothetical protein